MKYEIPLSQPRRRTLQGQVSVPGTLNHLDGSVLLLDTKCSQNKFKALYPPCMPKCFLPLLCTSYSWSFTCHGFTFVSVLPCVVRRRIFSHPLPVSQKLELGVTGSQKTHLAVAWRTSRKFSWGAWRRAEPLNYFGALVKENGRIMQKGHKHMGNASLFLGITRCILCWLSSSIPAINQFVAKQLIPKIGTAGFRLPEGIDWEVFQELTKMVPLPLVLISNNFWHT